MTKNNVESGMMKTSRRLRRQGWERQVQHLQKLELTSQLALGTAHDLNHLLAIILGNAEWLASTLPSGSPERDAAEHVRLAAEQAGSLTRQMLSYSRGQVSGHRVIDLNAVVQAARALIQTISGKSITVECRCSKQPALIVGDEIMVQQILLNLACNARDAMPDGGSLVITIEHSEAPSPNEAGVHDARFVLLTVTDSGPGIPAEILPKIFKPFFTTKGPGKGTGLGLATVASLVKQHKGHIDLITKDSAGTQFRMFFPCYGPVGHD